MWAMNTMHSAMVVRDSRRRTSYSNCLHATRCRYQAPPCSSHIAASSHNGGNLVTALASRRRRYESPRFSRRLFG